jgi:hypothetical protein
MEFFYQAEQGLGIVLYDEEPPAQNARANMMADFALRESKAAAMINSTCSQSVTTHIDVIRDPHQMWDVL